MRGDSFCSTARDTKAKSLWSCKQVRGDTFCSISSDTDSGNLKVTYEYESETDDNIKEQISYVKSLNVLVIDGKEIAQCN